MNMSSPGSGYSAPEQVYKDTHERKAAAKPSRYVSGLWIFILSFLPGLNYMAMGLMKRGLFFMSAFFGLIYLMSGFHFLAFAFVILFFASMCDAQSKRRRINNGEYVGDDVDDIIRFVVKYKTPILVILTFFALSTSLGFGSGGFWHGHWQRSGNFLALLILCFFGWHFIKNRSSGSRKDKDDDGHSN